MRVLAISGSLRQDSYNTALLRSAAELAPDGVAFELHDRLAEIPPYDQDIQDEGAPVCVEDLRDRIAAADAVLIATPEYNGSLPGLLKNAPGVRCVMASAMSISVPSCHCRSIRRVCSTIASA